MIWSVTLILRAFGVVNVEGLQATTFARRALIDGAAAGAAELPLKLDRSQNLANSQDFQFHRGRRWR